MACQIELYDTTCLECSKLITQKYSTSFSKGIRAFSKSYRFAIYAIYGFVRYADEIVDTFHAHDKVALMTGFRQQTFEAITRGISLNPVLHSFQLTVNRYQIDVTLIDAFLSSMEMDLRHSAYSQARFNQYIYGSAEVVGLMCLRVFCADDPALYGRLEGHARSLGAAFQKINFLRDIKADYVERGRTYFPEVNFDDFTNEDKQKIEAGIKADFDDALAGIKQLPKGSRVGVYMAYLYYLQLFKKIKRAPAHKILQKRIRVSAPKKMALYAKAALQLKLKAF